MCSLTEIGPLLLIRHAGAARTHHELGKDPNTGMTSDRLINRMETCLKSTAGQVMYKSKRDKQDIPGKVQTGTDQNTMK